MTELILFMMLVVGMVIGITLVSAGMWVVYRIHGGRMSLLDWMKEF